MNEKVWYLPYIEGVNHTRMFEPLSNANARMVHTMVVIAKCVYEGWSNVMVIFTN